MRVICPYTDIMPETRAALDASGYPWEARDVSASDTAYWGLLSGLWAAGEAFAVIEQDIAIGAATLPALATCEGGWCSFGFPYMASESYHGLGCVRFSAALLARVPGALDRVAVMSDATHAPKNWCRLDAWLAQVLTASGERRCEHSPPVGHLNRHPSHGCIAAPS